MGTRYDSQAAVYDDRAGLSASAVSSIVQAIARLASVKPGALLLEVGAGTGQIGFALQELPLRYVGFDLSEPMLQQFRQRFPPGKAMPELVLADGNERWPVDDHTVSVVFSSRALHLLDRRHVVEEVFRVVSPDGGYVLLGRVGREEESVKERMRRQMRRILKKRHGVEGAGREGLIDLLIARGAVELEPHVAATWRVSSTPAQSLESWRSKDGLAGRDVPAAAKAEVLSELEQWAVEEFGDLQASSESEESYILEGVKIPPYEER